MPNICLNQIYATGAPLLIEELREKLCEIFGDRINLNDDFATEEVADINLTLESDYRMPQKELKQVTSSMSDTKNLSIRILSDEPGEEYYEQAIFRNSQWSFDINPTINEQINALKKLGIEKIKEHILHNGEINLGDKCNYSALYVDDDGYGQLSYYQCTEIDPDDKLTVMLTDGLWLYEEDLTILNVMDLLTIIEEKQTNSNP